MRLVECAPAFDRFCRAFDVVDEAGRVGTVEIPDDMPTEPPAPMPAVMPLGKSALVHLAHRYPARGEFRTWDRMKPGRQRGDAAMWRVMTLDGDPEANRRQAMYEAERWVRDNHGDAAWDG